MSNDAVGDIAESAAVAVVEPESESEAARKRRRALEADICIKNHVIAAMGLGLIPSVLVDIVGVTGVEVKMIRDLAVIYRFPVPTKLVAYKVLISLIGSIGPLYFAAKMHSAMKGVPLLGHAVYVGFLSLSSGVAVYAVGKIFQEHYESGGTFLSSDNSVLRKFFKEKHKEGRGVVPTWVAQAT